ncbi:MAG: GTP-binding protein [Methanobacteriota archaeon]|nr:MAG: GTP-binding protein [Euryarchaeota archaeon]
MMKRLVSKLVLCGDLAVGKTSIRRAYFGDGFIRDHLSTLGADFAIKRVKIDTDTQLELQIWDLAGQPGFESLRKRFFKGASSAMLVFDLTRRETFENLDYWFSQLWEASPKKSMVIAVLGNKNDLQDHTVKEDEVEQFFKRLRDTYGLEQELMKYYETSALTGENIEECFQFVSNAILDDIRQQK